MEKHQTGSYPLVFKPNVSGKFSGKLILVNPVTFDHFEFTLQGFTDEPIAQDHL